MEEATVLARVTEQAIGICDLHLHHLENTGKEKIMQTQLSWTFHLNMCYLFCLLVQIFLGFLTSCKIGSKIKVETIFSLFQLVNPGDLLLSDMFFSV